MSLPFDDNQRRAIEVQNNAVVTAGAGSGKTAVLAERFLWLLDSRGAGVEQILALTFTQKAAAEMYERIYERLRGAGASLQGALESFDRSQISTLDSFCAEIVRGACGRYGLSPDFLCDEEEVRRLARDTSLDFLLESLEEPPVAELIRIQGFESLWLDLFTDLAFRHLHLAPRLDFARMLGAQLSRGRHDLRNSLEELAGYAERLLALAPRVKTLQANQDALRTVPQFRGLADGERCDELLDGLEAVSLRKSGSHSAPDLAEMNALVDCIRPLLEDARLLAYTLAQRPVLEQLFALLARFEERFVEAKRLRGLATFQDVEELAVDIMLHDGPLRQYYKQRFRHILIDEFQDNNRLQRDLLFLLAERLDSCGGTVPPAAELEADKLFFVGDEKQSIYRFRGADVSVFKALNRDLENAGGCALELDSNYRSEPGLVTFFNRVFEHVLAGAAGSGGGVNGQDARPYEARFQRMRPGRGGDSHPAQVHLLVKPPTEEGDEEMVGDREAEAHAVADLIRRFVAGGTLIVGKPGERRAAGFEDVAVLLRSTGNQIHFERAFRSLGIPYSTQNQRSLFLEAPINDFYLLLQLAVYPEDRSAYAGFLRGPFVNLSDETLLRLLLENSEPAGISAGSTAGPAPTLSSPSVSDPAECEKLRRGREVYDFVRNEADRLPLADLVHRLWYGFGYRHLILSDPRYHPYLEFYEYLVRLAEAADSRGEPLVRFLDFLRGNLGRYERLEELESLEGGAEGVQLLTIHKSKGLEFPLVVLADMGSAGRSGRSRQAYYRTEDFGIAVNLGRDSYFTRLGEQQAAEQEQAELKRLLYVACTRAMNHLVLSGCLGRGREPSSRTHLGLLLGALGLAEDFNAAPADGDGYRLEVHSIEDLSRREWSAAAPGPAALPIGVLRPLYETESRDRRAARREVSVTELCSRVAPTLEPEGGAGGSAAPGDGPPVRGRKLPALPVDPLLTAGQLEDSFGTLTHELLAAVLRDPGASPPEPEWGRLHIPAELRQSCLESADFLISGFLSSELGAAVRRSAKVETELPFVYRLGEGDRRLYVSGQIDAVVDSPEGLILIDFKTDREYREGEYACQLGLYTLALSELSGREVRPYLFLLRGATAVPLARRLDWQELIRAAGL